MAKMTLDTTGTLSTVNGFSNSGTPVNTYIPYPDGGRYRTTTTTKTGYLKITLPQSWTNTMLMFWVDIYNYETETSASYCIGGYNYSNGTWSNSPNAYSLCKSTKTTYGNLSVRFGHDGSKCAIYIGNSDTSWSYPQVTVRDLSCGYSNTQYSKWATGWSVDFTTTLGTITATITNPCVSYQADVLDGYHASEAATANTVVVRNNSKYVYLNYINSDTSNNENPTISQVLVTNGSDGFYRKASLAHLKSSLFTGGTMTGVLTIKHASFPTVQLERTDANNAGIGFKNSNGQLGYLSMNAVNGNIYKWNATASTNYVILDASNYNSYSPTLTGTGASGTWGISITGNAKTSTSLSGGTVSATTGAFSSTLTVTGGSTFTEKTVHNGSIDTEYIDVNKSANATSGGISLYGNTGSVTSYGIAMRAMYNGGLHGYNNGDWNIYNYISGGSSSAKRGWIWKSTNQGNVASISQFGDAQFDGNVRIGGNSGCELVYDDNMQSLNFVFS